MKFYLIDDDANVCNILKIIIQQKKLGEVCGMASNGMDALEDLKFIQPEFDGGLVGSPLKHPAGRSQADFTAFGIARHGCLL